MKSGPRLIALVALGLIGAAIAIAIVAGAVNSGCAAGSASLSAIARVSGPSLAIVSLAVLALLVAGARVFGRQAVAGDANTWRPGLIWLGLLFLVVFSAKLFLMRDNPVTVPFWDQWDGEARNLFIPFNSCRLSWPQMFAFHNEHRIFFTRLLALDLLTLNGVWDPRVEQVANAAMHAFTGVLLATMIWLANQRRRIDIIVFVCAFVFAMPFAWDNTLIGFQSAFYFLLLFSLPTFGLIGRYQAGSGPWFLGWTFALFALFTSAGGPTTAVALAGLALLKLANDPGGWREAIVNLAVAAGIAGLGVALTSPVLPQHEVLRAHSVNEFLFALWHNLAWPWIGNSWFAVPMWLPVLALVAATIWRRGRTTGLERLAIALGAWVAMNAAAIAYGRGAGAGYPVTRYMDFLSIGLIANVAALLAMLDRVNGRVTSTRAVWYALAAWLVFAVGGTDRLTGQILGDLGIWRQFFAAHTANVRTFLLTNERADFVSKRAPEEIPYPVPGSLADTLGDPFIRRILPAEVREPLHIEPSSVTGKGFVPFGSPVRARHDPLNPVWGSYADRGRATEGRFDSRSFPGCAAGLRLRFQVSGYLGWPHQSLAVKDLVSGRELPVIPWIVPRESWTTLTVPCPVHTFSVVAIDEDPESWFAFREPVVTGRLSARAEQLISWSRECFFATLALVALMLRRSTA